MSNFKMLVTNEGKHPAYKWAELAADDIVEISAQAPTTLMKEAMVFRKRLVDVLTHHHQIMMDHEQEIVKKRDHSIDDHYETEGHASSVVDEICDLAKGTSFADHFEKDHVKAHLEGVLNKYFKSAKLVERHHHHSENAKNSEAPALEAATAAKPKK